jgi:N-acetylneuraminic acid mutarotase
MSRSLAFSLSLCVAVVAACSPGSDGGSDGGSNNAGPCSSSVPAASGSCAVGVKGRLPAPRTAAVAVTAGEDVVLVGGQTIGGARTSEVTVGTVSGGAIAEWRPGPALPEKRSNPAVAFHKDKLYVFGGEPGVAAANEDVSTDVFVSAKAADGSYGAFEKGTPLPLARTGMAAAAGKDAIYLVGGGVARGSSAKDAAVLIARLDGTGAISGFDTSGPLPAARSGASAVVVGSRLYVVGGLFDGNEKSCATGTVLWSAIEASGRLGAWNTTTSLPKPPSGAALVASGNTLYLVGGISNYGDPSASVLAATVQDDGSLSQWKRAATLKDERYGHAAAVAGGKLFVAGGKIGTDVFDDVFSASLSEGAVGCN